VNRVADVQSSDDTAISGGTAPQPDKALVEALRAGNEEAFTALVEQYYNSMIRIARIYVPTLEIAEDVVQETWIAVLKGLDRFEGRSSLKTWVFTILTNRAKTRAQREGRYVPLEISDDEEFELAVVPERFRGVDDPGDAFHWLPDKLPQNWDNLPEDHLLSNETFNTIMAAINRLPPNQREVIRLRDVEGFTSAEVCDLFSLSETNQRVLLHRARSRVRQALENYL
jgi:RNA polymerase sigma-70 factor, ECF subfamily